MAHVLIGSATAVAAPEALFSLLAAGHRVSAFGRVDEAHALAGLPLSGYLSLPDPADDAQGAVSALEAAASSADAPETVLPLDDASLWLMAQSPRLMARIAGATEDGIDLALDKARQIQAARTAGLAVPPTRLISGHEELKHADIRFPAILKPRMAVRFQTPGLTRGKAHYLLSDEDVSGIGADEMTEPCLLQPLIPGVGEGVFGFAGAGGISGWSAHRRVRMMNPHGSGSSACRAIPPAPDLCTAVERFVAANRWRGPFMIEFLRDAQGTAWFMELNGRLWGSLALARRQGLEYPAMAVAQALQADYNPGPVTARPWPHVQRHLGRDLVHLLMVLRGPKSAFHKTGWPRLGSALGGVLRPAPKASFYNYDPEHPRFFLADAMRTVARAVRR